VSGGIAIAIPLFLFCILGLLYKQKSLQLTGGWWLVTGGWWLVAGGWWLAGLFVCTITLNQ
jgi:hypothetical protein